MYKLVCGEIIAGIGEFDACVELLGWLESEGANAQDFRIEEC